MKSGIASLRRTRSKECSVNQSDNIYSKFIELISQTMSLSYLKQRIQDNAVVGGCGPLAIIACPSTQEVNETTKRIADLLRYASKIRCFKAFGFTDQANVVVNFYFKTLREHPMSTTLRFSVIS